MAEQFSLCWDNFHSNLSSSFSELLKSEDLVDVTLAAEGRYLKAHKIVLSICSPYFQELFHVNPCQHPIVFLKDVSYSALSNLLQFMYQGEVKVSQDELTNFIKVAEALKIKGLTGDGLKENENSSETHSHPSESLPDISLSKETTLTRKTPYGGQSPARRKMMGPASKRPRNDLPEVPPHLIEDVRSVHPDPETVMNFKMEPEDVASHYDDNNEEFNYDDTNPDISNMSDSADYLLEAKMDTSGMKEGKPGTSSNADPSGDNQANVRYANYIANLMNTSRESDNRLDGKFHISRFGKHKDCAVCSNRKIKTPGARRTTRNYCDTCYKKPALHIGICWEKYHTLKVYK